MKTIIAEMFQHMKKKGFKKQIVLFDTCRYTTHGLFLICKQNPEWEISCIVHEQNELMKQLTQNRPDILICGIGNKLGDISMLFNMPNAPQVKCLLLIDKESTVLNDIFITAGFDAVISKSASIQTLHELLQTLLDNFNHHKDNISPFGTFSPLERDIISSLLKGIKPIDIAITLGISYRTVSRYKMSGLKKAGLKNLNELSSCQKKYIL